LVGVLDELVPDLNEKFQSGTRGAGSFAAVVRDVDAEKAFLRNRVGQVFP